MNQRWRATSRLGCIIAAVRIALLWAGWLAYSDAGWPQGVGYLLLMLSLPDIYIIRSWRAHPLQWVLAGTVLLFITSFVWAGLVLATMGRLRRDTHPRIAHD